MDRWPFAVVAFVVGLDDAGSRELGDGARRSHSGRVPMICICLPFAGFLSLGDRRQEQVTSAKVARRHPRNPSIQPAIHPAIVVKVSSQGECCNRGRQTKWSRYIGESENRQHSACLTHAIDIYHRSSSIDASEIEVILFVTSLFLKGTLQQTPLAGATVTYSHWL